MSELELRLSALSEEIAWPETPPLEFTAAAERKRGFRARSIALGVAMLLVVLAGVLALSPGARSSFLELFEIEGATVLRVENLPEVEAQRADYGDPVDRAEAVRRIGFELVDLGEPDGIYVSGRAASLVYGPVAKPRLVLTQVPGSVWDGFVKKVGSSGTDIAQVTVDGEAGLFVSGDEHFVMYVGENGAVTDERTYLAGTVLLWNRGPLLLRLEGDLTRAEAITLAESIE
jgi:hypothetical protein